MSLYRAHGEVQSLSFSILPYAITFKGRCEQLSKDTLSWSKKEDLPHMIPFQILTSDPCVVYISNTLSGSYVSHLDAGKMCLLRLNQCLSTTFPAGQGW